MKSLAFFILFIIFSIFVFFNLGNFLDATEKPSQSDLLVCLGGGDHMNRTRKSAELIESNLIKSNTIILTSFVKSIVDKQKEIYDDKRKLFLEELNYKDLNIIVEKSLRNTAEEIKFVKKYMVKNNLTTVTLVSEPAHSRRILLYSYFLKVKGDENLKFKVVASDDKNWNKYAYYENRYSLNYALTEVAKIIYGIFAYGILDRFGILDNFENTFKDEIKEMKKEVHKNINSATL